MAKGSVRCQLHHLMDVMVGDVNITRNVARHTAGAGPEGSTLWGVEPAASVHITPAARTAAAGPTVATNSFFFMRGSCLLAWATFFA